MRTVAAILDSGIKSVSDLQESLLLAAKLEFSTIPPYLCAEWSVKPAEDPDAVAGMIDDIVMQEMLHMGLVLNMLTAIGGKPVLADKDFVPTYPTDGLPGNVHPHLLVDLLPLGKSALSSFLQIELPEHPILLALTKPFPTIGAFYDAISDAFGTVKPPIDDKATQVEISVGVDNDNVFRIDSITKAQTAIEEIKEQGEGTTASPDQGSFDPDHPAHYYNFLQIDQGHTLKPGPDGKLHPVPPDIRMPGVMQFARSSDSHASDGFNVILSDLLRLLQQAWTGGPGTIGKAVGQMRKLHTAGSALIAAGICPEFRWTDKSSLP